MMQNQHGFTLTELIIAMAVFSFVLAIITVGFITLVRTQQKALAERNTQQNARRSLEEMVRHVREARDVSVIDCSQDGVPRDQIGIELSGTVWTYFIAENANQDHLFRVQANPGDDCNTPPGAAESWEQLTSDAVEATRLNANRPTGTTASVRLEVSVASAGQALAPDKKSCLEAANQYCSVTTLSTTASVRGGAQ